MDGLIVGIEMQARRKNEHIEVRRKRCQGDQLAREDTAARVTRRGRACVRARDGACVCDIQLWRSRKPHSSSNGGGSISPTRRPEEREVCVRRYRAKLKPAEGGSVTQSAAWRCRSS
ncbi:hypothetical protein Q8A73_013287 [Channa argus]|nr:hypothetical protein Q8A73_013287 [Channa argus]